MQEIIIRINGDERLVEPNSSVAEVLRALDIVSDRVAVELNKSIVRKRDWDKTRVPPGAEIEIVEFVGGG